MGELKITVEWVKAHEGTIGNELADALAKRGTIIVTQGCEPWLPVSNDNIKQSITPTLTEGGRRGGKVRAHVRCL